MIRLEVEGSSFLSTAEELITPLTKNFDNIVANKSSYLISFFF